MALVQRHKMTILRDSQMLTDSNKGLTPDYASPELYQGAVITATDIFALGISIYELCTGKPPISNTSMTTAIALLNNNGFIPDLPQDYSQRFNTMVKNGERKSKFAHLDVLAQLSKSRVEQGSNFAFWLSKI
ncbi:MAG: protein kinase [Saprospiraceae bacterium]|nr:protein kinase [Saprospiraceae bacterium]